MTAMQVPLPLQVSGEQQPLGSVRQLPPLMTHGPVGVVVATCCVHCGVWLCVVMSWNGRKNAGNDGSVPFASERLIAAIQSLGCWHAGSNVEPCAPPASS